MRWQGSEERGGRPWRVGLRHLVFLLSSVSGNSSHSAQPWTCHGQALNQTLLGCNRLSTFPDTATPSQAFQRREQGGLGT